MQSASMTLTINVLGMLQITAATLPPAVVGQAYSFQLSATGGTGNYSWMVTAGSMPTGLTLSSSGLISGLPTVQGSSSFTVTVQDY